ncbi:ABC-F family ATP-binding cassette domain-containing protein [Muriicola marianensis]|uniref:ABC transporter n=1 Tax=Muriicola marianensis TaxID=1324801 RepID=A0ABQ1QRQ2_9FLAO|nr:ABC-F family ATP-binding cassette domain-containing protein [Muriicola marianensis]GGD42773.1 ABC transporter [Muriicola marianensis]
MNLVSVEEISKGFGERILFSGLSFGINAGQKIALIAQNGTGKTSILNILAGKDQPDTGMVNTRKGLRISYLEQDPDLQEDLTLEETVFRSDNEILKVIRDYEKALDNPGDQKRYQKAFEAMERNSAWDFETQYKQILFRLQLTDLQARVGTLSGGQKKRLALAHALLNKPDLLILDEPTNHLDLEMIEWLENYFARESITLFMVTHDRYFLERVCDEILELDGGKLYSYKGNYSYFLEKKEAREMRDVVELHKSKQLYKKELDWMRRQPKARTTKSKSRIDDFHEIKSKALQRRKDHEVQLEINMERLGSKILEFHNVVKSFPDTPILNKFNYSFVKGERLGIIGKNGTGKTTFLNLLTGNALPDGGKIITGETVKFGYYTQEGIPVKEGQKVIEVIREIAEYIPLKKGRQLSAQQLLERFLFDRKKQYDFVEKLSGGEKKRLYLCTVLIQNPNFLILDEPTNDLDVVTLNVLESFLLDYPGCLVVVSHDRYFMDKIVDHLFVFRGEGVIDDFPGNYSDFRAYEDSLDASKKAEKASDAEKGQTTGSPWREEGKRSNLSYAEQKEYKQLEREIQKLETRKKELQDAFLNPDITPEEIADLSKSLQETEQQIDQKTERWFEISVRAES